MDFIVDTTLPADVVIGATGLVGLAQEIRTVLTTRKGSVPLDREFGLDWSFLDRPLAAALPRYVGEVSRQLEKYVPRIKVLEVRFKPREQGTAQAAADAAEGKLFPVVRVAVRKEYIHEFTQDRIVQGGRS